MHYSVQGLRYSPYVTRYRTREGLLRPFDGASRARTSGIRARSGLASRLLAAGDLVWRPFLFSRPRARGSCSNLHRRAGRASPSRP